MSRLKPRPHNLQQERINRVRNTYAKCKSVGEGASKPAPLKSIRARHPKAAITESRNRSAEARRRSRANGELDFAAAGFHTLEGLRKLIEANFFSDEVVGENVAAANRFQSFADEARRVMKRGNDLDLGIVNFGRLDF